MKLRQKLAVVLASAMVVTAVPVVTMAASTNSLTRETLKVKEDTEFKDVTTANALRIKFTGNSGDSETFYLELDNAEWDEDTLWDAAQNNSDFEARDKDNKKAEKKDEVECYVYTKYNITYERQSDSSMKIYIPGENVGEDTVVQIPILAKAKDGDAKVTVVAKDGTTVSKGSFVFATTAEKKMSVTVKDPSTFYTKGDIADIEIEESYKGALKDGGTFTIEIDDSDFAFNNATITLEGKYGFSKYGENKTFKAEIDKKDDGKMTITLPSYEEAKINPTTMGTWVIKDVEVKSSSKKPSEGDFLVDIKGDDLESEKTNVKVATVSQYGVYVKMKDDKAEDVKAGRIEEVEFEVGESVEDSMITGREFEMTLDNGYWNYKQFVKDYFGEGSEKLLEAADVKKESDLDDDAYKKAAAEIDSKWLAKKIVDNAKDWTIDTCEAEFDTDSDGDAIPETIIFTIGQDDEKQSVQSNDDNDVLKFKTDIVVSVENKEKEKVTLKVSGRGVDNEASTTAVNIINPFNVTFEQAVLKAGLQGQVSGTVTLTETDKDMFQKGDITFKIKKDDEDFGIYLKDVTVEVSDGLKGTKSDVTKGKAGNAKVELTLNRTSKEAATIKFKDMTFTTDRTVPEGTYDLEISGKSVDADENTITVKDFVKISTANPEDLTTNGLAKGTAKFVIGESKYTLNDKEVAMDAPSYIQNPGYTMVPVRFVANAFGVAESNILFGKGTVTIFAGERTISLTTGSNVAVVNGNNVALGTAVVNKDGRTYVPAGQIASLLGIKSTWDASSKTATFEN